MSKKRVIRHLIGKLENLFLCGILNSSYLCIISYEMTKFSNSRHLILSEISFYNGIVTGIRLKG